MERKLSAPAALLIPALTIVATAPAAGLTHDVPGDS